MCAITMNKRKNQEATVSQPPRKMQRIIMSSLPDRMLASAKAAAMNDECKPDATLAQILAAEQCSTTIQSFDSCSDFFHAPTQAEIDAYDHAAIAAIRNQDMDTLRQYHAQGRPLKCSNKFGESLLHMACRKGMLQVTTFIVKEAEVPLAVCDDYGRTPLHDACWAHETNFPLVDLILTECPDLLYIQDKRGNTPLSYLRKDKWAAWNKFLNGKTAEFLKPKTLPSC
jgi:Ankyrin repeats (3 copies)